MWDRSVNIKHEDKALQCEGKCNRWYHCRCIFGFELKAALSIKRCLCLTTNGYVRTVWGQLPHAVEQHRCCKRSSFQFSKNIPTPHTVGKQFYMRLLWTYLFGIYSASCKLTSAFMWNELIACRRANDVVSCSAHFIFNTQLGRTGTKWSIWWADNCPGQNKNHVVIWFFQHLILRSVYTRIDYKFLVVGHSCGPTD